MHPQAAPAADRARRRVCAASFSWCGNTRSMPPPWMSNSSPSSASAIAEHSMCQPGRPRPHGESHDVSSPSLCAFQSAKSSGSSFRSAPSTPSPWSIWSTSRRDSSPYSGSVRTRKYTSPPAGVGVAALHQRADQVEDRLDVLGRQRLVVGPAEPEPLGVGEVVADHLARQLGRVAPGGARGVVDLVVDVGDVRDQRRVVALVLEEPLELREDHERPRVADVHARVHGRPAGVDADLPGVARLQRPHRPRARVVEVDGPHRGRGP